MSSDFLLVFEHFVAIIFPLHACRFVWKGVFLAITLASFHAVYSCLRSFVVLSNGSIRSLVSTYSRLIGLNIIIKSSLSHLFYVGRLTSFNLSSNVKSTKLVPFLFMVFVFFLVCLCVSCQVAMQLLNYHYEYFHHVLIHTMKRHSDIFKDLPCY